MSNPFEDMASQATRPAQKRMAREDRQPMVPSPIEKKLLQQRKQFNLFKQWKREIREGMTRGTYGPEIIELFKMLRRNPETGDMVRWVRKAKWLLKSNDEVKLTILGYIEHSIIRWNVRHGKPPFNDSLPWEPDCPSVIIRKLLTGV